MTTKAKTQTEHNFLTFVRPSAFQNIKLVPGADQSRIIQPPHIYVKPSSDYNCIFRPLEVASAKNRPQKRCTPWTNCSGLYAMTHTGVSMSRRIINNTSDQQVVTAKPTTVRRRRSLSHASFLWLAVYLFPLRPLVMSLQIKVDSRGTRLILWIKEEKN